MSGCPSSTSNLGPARVPRHPELAGSEQRVTELEEAELTEGQGRVLSGHKTAQAYRGYAKETMRRALAATGKRHAHLLVQKQLEKQSSTEFQMAGGIHLSKRAQDPRENKAVSVEISAL